MKRLFKVSTMSTVAAVAFVINPLWITSCEKKPTVNFTQAEMLSELTEAVGTHAMTFDDGVLTIDLKIDGLDTTGAETKSAGLAPSFVQTAAACGHHEEEFVVGASACVDTFETLMRFKADVTVTWAPKEGEPVTFVGPVDSVYRVTSQTLVTGEIEFQTSFPGGSKLDVALSTEDGDGANFQVQAFKLSLPDQTIEAGTLARDELIEF